MIMMPLLLRTLVIAAAHRTCRLLAPHTVTSSTGGITLAGGRIPCPGTGRRHASQLGLAVNAWLGWWWLDACAGLAVAAVAIKEGRGAWRGSSCC